LFISVKVANEPEFRDAPVKVRAPLFQTSETRLPNELRVRVALFQTDVAIVVVETIVEPTTKVLSNLTKSPPGAEPQVM
jgi:hypothetical protein